MTPTQRELHVAHIARMRRLSPVVRSACTPIEPLRPTPTPPADPIIIWPPKSWRIKNEVCKEFAVSMSNLCGPSRFHKVTWPRFIAMYLCRHLLQLSYPKIGRKFGCKDHATVLRAVRKIALQRQTDVELNDTIERIITSLGAKVPQ